MEIKVASIPGPAPKRITVNEGDTIQSILDRAEIKLEEHNEVRLDGEVAENLKAPLTGEHISLVVGKRTSGN